MSNRERLVLYPPIEPYWQGRLPVTGGHDLYFEESQRRVLDFYTDGTLRVPAPTSRVWVCNRARYRTNIRFGDPKVWGEDGGEFDLNRLPPW